MFRKHYIAALEYGLCSTIKDVEFVLKQPDQTVAVTVLRVWDCLDAKNSETIAVKQLFGDMLITMPGADIDKTVLNSLPDSIEHSAGFADALIAQVIYEASRQVKSLPVLIDLVKACKPLADLMSGKKSAAVDEITAALKGNISVIHQVFGKNITLSNKSIDQVAERFSRELQELPENAQIILIERAAQLTYQQLTKEKSQTLNR